MSSQTIAPAPLSIQKSTSESTLEMLQSNTSTDSPIKKVVVSIVRNPSSSQICTSPVSPYNSKEIDSTDSKLASVISTQ
jgi:hypothetical protein